MLSTLSVTAQESIDLRQGRSRAQEGREQAQHAYGTATARRFPPQAIRAEGRLPNWQPKAGPTLGWRSAFRTGQYQRSGPAGRSHTSGRGGPARPRGVHQHHLGAQRTGRMRTRSPTMPEPSTISRNSRGQRLGCWPGQAGGQTGTGWLVGWFPGQAGKACRALGSGSHRALCLWRRGFRGG